MDAWTHTLDLDAADARLPRVRETRVRYVGKATPVVGVEPRLDQRRSAVERAGQASRSKWGRSRRSRLVESTFFVVTLAVICWLYLGVVPAQML